MKINSFNTKSLATNSVVSKPAFGNEQLPGSRPQTNHWLHLSGRVTRGGIELDPLSAVDEDSLLKNLANAARDLREYPNWEAANVSRTIYSDGSGNISYKLSRVESNLGKDNYGICCHVDPQGHPDDISIVTSTKPLKVSREGTVYSTEVIKPTLSTGRQESFNELTRTAVTANNYYNLEKDNVIADAVSMLQPVQTGEQAALELNQAALEKVYDLQKPVCSQPVIPDNQVVQTTSQIELQAGIQPQKGVLGQIREFLW